MVARGDIAGTFVRPNSHDWDLAAADLILSEAGGQVLTADGKALTYGCETPTKAITGMARSSQQVVCLWIICWTLSPKPPSDKQARVLTLILIDHFLDGQP